MNPISGLECLCKEFDCQSARCEISFFAGHLACVNAQMAGVGERCGVVRQSPTKCLQSAPGCWTNPTLQPTNNGHYQGFLDGVCAGLKLVSTSPPARHFMMLDVVVIPNLKVQASAFESSISAANLADEQPRRRFMAMRGSTSTRNSIGSSHALIGSFASVTF
jgi:hypothetical protein